MVRLELVNLVEKRVEAVDDVSYIANSMAGSAATYELSFSSTSKIRW